MSIEKWLSEEIDKEKREKIEEIYKSLPEEKVQDLKKRKIQELSKSKSKIQSEKTGSQNILNDILDFKEWLNQRTYLKGDLNKIEVWIKNLNNKLNFIAETNKNEALINNKSQLIEEFRKIPPKFLDEKTRIALNKKLHGIQKTNSDNYYLRKLKSLIGEKLKETSYYEILKIILES